MIRRLSPGLAATAALFAALASGAGASVRSDTVEARPGPLASMSAVIGGARWPGKVARITYFNAAEQRWAVKRGVKAWNSSGARVRFVAVKRRRRAKLVIANQRGPRSDSLVSGYASLGYIYPGGAGMQLSRLATPRRPHYNMAGVVAHELGHVLGLNHEDRRCATMNTVLWSGCPSARPCRLLERDDIAGAVRMYGGRVRMKRPSFCPKPPTDVRVTGDPREYGVTLGWTNPRGPFFDRVQAARGKGSCPRKVPRFGGYGTEGRAGGPGTLRDGGLTTDGRLAQGRYCYSLWTVGDGMGPRSRRTTVWVDFDPPPPGPPAGFTGTAAAAGEVTLAWTPPAHPELAGVEGAGARDSCPTSREDGDHFFSGERSATTQLYAPGKYCFAAWSVDTLGAATGPVTTWVEYSGSPPEAAFDAYSYGLTVDFVDYSSDPDGEEIVAWRWEFGDSTPASGEQFPQHTYASPGTYTVRLTVTDAGGQSGSVAQPVTVDSP